MNETKKVPASAATLTGTVESGAASQAGHQLQADSTMKSETKQVGYVAQFLPMGEKNAVSLQTLKTLLHLPGRTIRQMIEFERRREIPICSNNVTGYFILADSRERDRFVANMEKRAAEILLTAEAVKRAKID